MQTRLISILSSGPVPMLNISGPIENLRVSETLYQVLKSNPHVKLKLVEEPKKEPTPTNTQNPVNNTPNSGNVDLSDEEELLVSPEGAQAAVDRDDLQIEKALKKNKPAKSNMGSPKAIKNASDKATKEVKGKKNVSTGTFKDTYTKDELAGLTKAQLKEILVARGLHGKYHDTVEMLIEKVLNSNK